MTVYCSHCSTGYLLPDHLLGPRGARVRCPNCGKTFVVLRESPREGAAVVAPEPASAPAGGSAPEPASRSASPAAAAAGATPDEALARALLDALAVEAGPRLTEARSRGRVLAEFGPDLMRSVDEFRRRASGPGALPAFRRALRERWGVDLITGVEG